MASPDQGTPVSVFPPFDVDIPFHAPAATIMAASTLASCGSSEQSGESDWAWPISSQTTASRQPVISIEIFKSMQPPSRATLSWGVMFLRLCLQLYHIHPSNFCYERRQRHGSPTKCLTVLWGLESETLVSFIILLRKPTVLVTI